MKQLLIILLIAIVGCKQSNNDKMNALLSEKKQVEDSLSHYLNYEAYYDDKFRAEEDAAQRNLYLDTFSIYNRNVVFTEGRLETLNYSIDSLGKLK